MAANEFSTTSPIIRQELREYGHDMYFVFSISNALLIPDDWTIFQDLSTTCVTTPTSWKIKITLDRFPSSQVVSGTAKIKRTDSIKQAVGALFELTVFHEEFGYHIPVPDSVPEYDRVFNPGDLLLVNISNIVPSSHTNLLRDTVSLTFRLSVGECHRPSTSPLKPSPPKPSPKKPPPKKQLDFDKRWHHTAR